MRILMTSRRTGGAVAGCALVLGCAIVVAGCGSSSAAPPATTTTTTAPSGTTATSSTATFTAYRNCLQSHGVTLPQGGFGFGRGAGGAQGVTGAGGPTGAGGFFRRGATGGRGPSGAGGFFRRGGSGPTGARGFGGTLSPAQQKALSACASLRPTGGFGLGGGGGAGFSASNPSFAKFQACLAQHGVQTGTTASRTSPAFQTALAACRSLLPAGPGGGFLGGGAAAGTGTTGATGSTTSDFARFQACLKQHGIQPGAANQSQSATSAALAACRSLLPNNGNGTAATTTTG